MRIFGAITKLETQDDGTLKVIGVASSGAVDEADERVDPAAMKAALPDYMRFGALREMHGLTAAGATLSAEVDDEGQTRIEAHVVDPLAVKKVRLGVYKGFSIGGRVLERDVRDRNRITALRLDEISLVDRPCNPEAVIQMWKSGGQPGPGPTNAQVIAKAIELAAAAGRRSRYKDFVVKARHLLTQAQPTPALADETLDKLGARNSQADLAHIQAAHDELVALGAKCRGCGADSDGDDGDQADADDFTPQAANDNNPPDGGDGLTKTALAIRAELGDQIDGLRRGFADLQKRFDDLAAEPLPPRTLAGWARAVTKAEDAAGEAPITAESLRKHLENLTPEDRAQLELRAALSRPIAIHSR